MLVIIRNVLQTDRNIVSWELIKNSHTLLVPTDETLYTQINSCHGCFPPTTDLIFLPLFMYWMSTLSNLYTGFGSSQSSAINCPPCPALQQIHQFLSHCSNLSLHIVWIITNLNSSLNTLLQIAALNKEEK